MDTIIIGIDHNGDEVGRYDNRRPDGTLCDGLTSSAIDGAVQEMKRRHPSIVRVVIDVAC